MADPDRLEDMVAQLAQRLDDASAPSDPFAAMSTPPAGPGRGPSKGRYGLAIAAVAAAMLGLLVAMTAWPGEDGPADLTTGSEPPVPHIAIGRSGSSSGDAPLGDGQSVEVRGDGFKAQQEVVLQQCGAAGCDKWRPGVVVEADDSGTFATQFVVYHDIAPTRSAGAAIAWAPCESCSIKADTTAGAFTGAEATVTVSATATPLHPTITITPAGPYAPGQMVRVEGRGFQFDPDGLGVGLAYCPADGARYEECGGGPELGDFGIGPDGTFVVEQFALPETSEDLAGVDCTDLRGTCTVSWILYDDGPLPPGVGLDMGS